MSVKVIKTEQSKDWIDATVKNIRETIKTNQLHMDMNLLPKGMKDAIENNTKDNRLIPLILKYKQLGANGIPKELKEYLEKLIDWLHSLPQKSEGTPIRISLSTGDIWVLNGFIYKIEYKNQLRHSFEDEELLILASYDQERQKFEQLKRKYKSPDIEQEVFQRERISENVRIAVWRRDGGKCVRCGSREKLEYDHIVPVSKGGSNTVRNIELLCEKCNRQKSNNIA